MTNEVPRTRRSSKRLLVKLMVLVLGMFGFGYALVPMYNVLCKQLGINGKTGGAETYDAKTAAIDESRTVTIEFIATNNEQMPWEFRPNQRKLKIHPGEMRQVSFFAENTTNNTMTVQAIPSVTPGIAANYLKKTECFCFKQQTFAAHQKMDMPILFHIDPALPKSIHTITLSYTLFDLTSTRRS
jgi:cytochrome c oxidase assembly protein subunit 11